MFQRFDSPSGLGQAGVSRTEQMKALGVIGLVPGVVHEVWDCLRELAHLDENLGQRITGFVIMGIKTQSFFEVGNRLFVPERRSILGI